MNHHDLAFFASLADILVPLFIIGGAVAVVIASLSSYRDKKWQNLVEANTGLSQLAQVRKEETEQLTKDRDQWKQKYFEEHDRTEQLWKLVSRNSKDRDPRKDGT